MALKVTYNKTWQSDISGGMNEALLELTTDIDRHAKIIAPKASRALVNSSVISKVTDGFKITFGSGRVPYARKRHYENKKNPQTIGYLAKAGDNVARGNISKYFRNKV